MMHDWCLETSVYVHVTCVNFKHTINWVQKQCSEIITTLNDDLEKWFATHDVMDALGVVYLQYWPKFSCQVTFLIHMAILKGFYRQPKKLGCTQTWINII
jgi:hypothetical protein